MSPILKQFFKELQQWIQDGTPEDGRHFRVRDGVCDNLDRWLYNNHENSYRIKDVANEHSDLLLELYGTSLYPFNGAGKVRFIDEVVNGDTWKNEERLNYVKQQAAAGEADE